jgi:hypothetical protein
MGRVAGARFKLGSDRDSLGIAVKMGNEVPPLAGGITRRWNGPRRRYTSSAVERRACAAAAAQRHYVMGHEPLDYRGPEPKKPRSYGWLSVAVALAILFALWIGFGYWYGWALRGIK